MDFRTQDNEMRTSGSALSYGGTHLTKESSGGGEKRRLGNIHNGTPTALSAFTATHQTLDHHHPLQPHHVQPVPLTTRDLDPDRVGSTAVAPSGAVLSGGPKSKTPSSTSTTSSVRYRECLKNHAANIGGNVYDGCGEFMPCGEEGTLEALKCAACDCHRNFHRKEVDGETTPFGPGSRSRSIMLSPLQLPPPLPSPSSALHHHRHQKFSIVQPMSVAFGGGGTESSSEDLNVFDNVDGVGGGMAPPFSLSKKRFRTKFTAEQKVRMVEFAERVGWRIQKQDEEDVEKFCDEVGVKRQVLRVWMHNNKNTARKMQHDHDITTTTSQLALENVEAHDQEPGQGGGGTDT
ncbi:zinc-finger homeodomain protein 5 [Rosa sericea]